MQCSIFLDGSRLAQCTLRSRAKTTKKARNLWLVTTATALERLLRDRECSAEKLDVPMGPNSAYVLSFPSHQAADCFAEETAAETIVSRCLRAEDVIGDGPDLHFTTPEEFEKWFSAHLSEFRLLFVEWTQPISDFPKSCDLDTGLAILRRKLTGCNVREVDAVPGVLLVEDFISQDEEAELMKVISEQPWQQNLKRRVQHYGYAFQYESLYIDRRENRVPPMPPFVQPIIDRLGQYIPWRPDQLTINEYEPGQGIGFHVDTHSAFNEAIIVVSLGSSLNFEFRREVRGGGLEYKEYRLAERSLCIFSDEARYDWLHGIKSRKTDLDESGVRHFRRLRVSLTFRLLNWRKNFSCDCPWPLLCDTQTPSSLKKPERVASSTEESDARTSSSPQSIALSLADG